VFIVDVSVGLCNFCLSHFYHADTIQSAADLLVSLFFSAFHLSFPQQLIADCCQVTYMTNGSLLWH